MGREGESERKKINGSISGEKKVTKHKGIFRKIDFLFWTLEARMALGGEDAYLVLGWLEPISLRFVKNRQLGQLVLEGCV